MKKDNPVKRAYERKPKNNRKQIKLGKIKAQEVAELMASYKYAS